MSMFGIIAGAILGVVLYQHRHKLLTLFNNNLGGVVKKQIQTNKDIVNGMIGKYEMGEYVTPGQTLSFLVIAESDMPPMGNVNDYLRDKNISAICRVFRTNNTEGGVVQYRHAWKVYIGQSDVGIDTALLINTISNFY